MKMTEQGPKEEKEKKPRYVSKDGFVATDVMRGMEISNLLEALPYPDAFVCGGHARYMLSKHTSPAPAHDVDIFCRNEAAYERVMELLKKECALEQGHENEMAVSFKALKPEDANERARGLMLPWLPRIQVIKPLTKGAIVSEGSVEDILGAFDFTVTRAAVQHDDVMPGEIFGLADADFEYDEQHRYLRIKNIHCPISSTLRCIKYGKKGYWTRPFEVLKLMTDWEGRDDEYRMGLVKMLEELEESGELTREQIDELEALMRID